MQKEIQGELIYSNNNYCKLEPQYQLTYSRDVLVADSAFPKDALAFSVNMRYRGSEWMLCIKACGMENSQLNGKFHPKGKINTIS